MTNSHTGFLRNFIGGFALGALALVAVQLTGQDDAKMVHSAPATIERLG